jgi:hypothetical protein
MPKPSIRAWRALASATDIQCPEQLFRSKNKSKDTPTASARRSASPGLVVRERSPVTRPCACTFVTNWLIAANWLSAGRDPAEPF